MSAISRPSRPVSPRYGHSRQYTRWMCIMLRQTRAALHFRRRSATSGASTHSRGEHPVPPELADVEEEAQRVGERWHAIPYRVFMSKSLGKSPVCSVLLSSRARVRPFQRRRHRDLKHVGEFRVAPAVGRVAPNAARDVRTCTPEDAIPAKTTAAARGVRSAA